LGKELRKVLIRQGDLLKKPGESILTQISTSKKEQDAINVFAAHRAGKPDYPVVCIQNVKVVYQ
jgi:hypothetical protein